MDLSKAIVEAYKSYTQEITDEIEEEIRATAKRVRATAKKKAPVQTGEYKKQIKVDKNKKNIIKGQYINTVYVGDGEHRLTHLLEKGHAKRSGGRVKAKPHFGPAWEDEESGLVSRIEKIISG